MKFILDNEGKVAASDFPMIFKLTVLASKGFSNCAVNSREVAAVKRMAASGFFKDASVVSGRLIFRFQDAYQQNVDNEAARGKALQEKLMIQKLNPQRKTLDRLEKEGVVIVSPGTHTKLVGKSVEGMVIDEAADCPTNLPTPRVLPKKLSGSIDDLVAVLKSSTDPVEKRKLRAKLRKLGHRGGSKQ